jgi:hypothetical protein
VPDLRKPSHNLLSIKRQPTICDFRFQASIIACNVGRIPAIQIGGRLRIKKSSLKSSLERHVLRRDMRGRPTVLVVENDPELQEQFRTLLRKPLKFEHLVQTVTTLGSCVSK